MAEMRRTSGFDSYEALRLEHMRRSRGAAARRRAAGDGPYNPAAVLEFIEAIKSAGAVIGSDAERQSAQGMLDYWAAEYVNSSEVDPMTWTAPVLAPHQEAKVSDEAEAELATDADADHHHAELGRQIRIAALARQWRDSGGYAGYLLTGQALDDARGLRGKDPDIEALVTASERNVVLSARNWRAAYAAAAVFLGIVAVALFVLWSQAKVETRLARDQTTRAENLARELTDKIAELQRQRQQSEENLAQSNDALNRANEDFSRRLESLKPPLQTALDHSMRLVIEGKLDRTPLSREFLVLLDAEIKAAVSAGRIDRRQLPPEYLAALDGGEVKGVDSFPEGDPLLAGFDPEFTGGFVPFPQLAAELAAKAYGSGAAINYVNYSIALSGERRMAIVAASNLDRQRRRVLRRPWAASASMDRFGYDPRVPAGMQIGDHFYEAEPRFNRGNLVTRSEISWGPYFEGDAGIAERKLANMVNVYTNMTPQFDDFDRSVWQGAERWVLSDHNRPASRISVFSGPVFRQDDPVRSGVQVPQSYWKIAVSLRGDSKGELVVDAFEIPQLAESSGEPMARAEFDPGKYRVEVAHIERLTGLNFGPDMRYAEGTTNGSYVEEPSVGDRLAAKVGALDAVTEEQRKETAREIVEALRDGAIPEPEKRKIVVALTGLASEASVLSLTDTGRDNLLQVLAEIPQGSLNLPSWLDAKALLRRASADLEIRARNGGLKIGQDAQKYLDVIKGLAGLNEKMLYTVYLQFAGMGREQVVAVSNKLRSLGWVLPPEERTPNAAKQNEIRYRDTADQKAAELLAADLRALGLASVRGVKRVPRIGPGNMEIWISN